MEREWKIWEWPTDSTADWEPVTTTGSEPQSEDDSEDRRQVSGRKLRFPLRRGQAADSLRAFVAARAKIAAAYPYLRRSRRDRRLCSRRGG